VGAETIYKISFKNYTLHDLFIFLKNYEHTYIHYWLLLVQ